MVVPLLFAGLLLLTVVVFLFVVFLFASTEFDVLPEELASVLLFVS